MDELAAELAEELRVLSPNSEVFIDTSRDGWPSVHVYQTVAGPNALYATVYFNDTGMKLCLSDGSRHDFDYVNPESIDNLITMIKTKLDAG